MAPLTRKRKSEQDAASIEAAAEPAAARPKRSKKLAVRAKDDETAADEDRPEAAQGTMKVFTDDDNDIDMEQPLPVAAKPTATVTEEEDDESDDEAPEAVSTQQAASSIKKSTQAAQKAAHEQAAAEKRKRQQRDALFKQQAEERKKLEDDSKAAADALAAQESAAIADLPPTEANSRRRRAGKFEIPDVLPAEFLTDSSSEDEVDGDRMDLDIRPKKRKVTAIEKKLSRQDRGPRDEQIGSTVFRVTKKTDDRIAPKAKKHAKSSKELLLKRNRASVQPRSGFLLKK